METLLIIFGFIIVILSIIIHEIAHGSMAYALGDETAKSQGRLSLNPISHIDPVGTILLPLLLSMVPSNPVIIGWAKPVPVNFNNIKDKRWGALKVSLAGPMANFVIAIIFALIIRFMPGSEMFVIFQMAVVYNLLLGIFNLIPIPPLDGSHILFDLLPQGQSLEKLKYFLMQYGFFILIFFIFIFPQLSWIYSIVGNMFFFLTGQPIVF